MRLPHLEAQFPNLATIGYEKTSEQDPSYNCIAFAADDTTNWWQPIHRPYPGIYWPPGAPTDDHIDSYRVAFELQGYEVCNSAALERKYEKVALYWGVSLSGNEGPHAAKQTPDGKWKSKCGDLEDIRHNALSALEGDGYLPGYGRVIYIMRRVREGEEWQISTS